MPIPPRAVCLRNPTQCAAIGLALEMLPGVSKDSEALNVATYFFRDVWSSIGLFRGVHTGSPTNRRIACAASMKIRAAARHAAGHLATGPCFIVLRQHRGGIFDCAGDKLKKTACIWFCHSRWMYSWCLSCCYLDVVVAVKGEAVVDALRQHNHVALPAVYPDPPLVKVPDIKIPCMPQSWPFYWLPPIPAETNACGPAIQEHCYKRLAVEGVSVTWQGCSVSTVRAGSPYRCPPAQI